MGFWKKLFGLEGDAVKQSHGSGETTTDGNMALRSSSIVNVWAAVDMRTISWLQQKPREEAIGFAIQVSQVIADDIYPAIKEWMDREKSFPSIIMADPFSQDNVVKVVIQLCKGENRNGEGSSGNATAS